MSDTTEAKEIPAEGIVYHGTVQMVQKDFFEGKYQAIVSSNGARLSIDTDFPLNFGAEFDIILKPVAPDADSSN